MAKTLIPIFADQLSLNLSSLVTREPEDSVILMMEVVEEANTVPHHRMKMAFLFSAMRHFAKELQQGGWRVDYVKLDDPQNSGSFSGEVKRAISRHSPEEIRLCEPSEYRVLDCVRAWEREFNIPVHLTLDDRFLATKEDFADWAKDRKQLRMEYFYREMRRKTNLLMAGDKPVEGKWNFDSENRKPAKNDLFMPKPLKTKPDQITQDVIKMIEAMFPTRFGKLESFFFAVDREGAKACLKNFVKEALPDFGDYQDAMLVDEPFLYHSLLSMYLNVGLLSPLEICRAVEAAYEAGEVPINAAEGYIRQIIGWREYVRGIYWLKMPDYMKENALSATRDLPDFYWTAETDMMCLSQAIGQTRDYAYAHHIQRLMITGNFALLIGVDPVQIHEWYLAVYVDAFEWVELPNTLGMSQFADDGLLGSKPYASSGAYINRMSNYCAACRYNVKDRVGEKACPFNSLYWHFMNRNRDVLEGNPRLGMAFRNLDKMDGKTKMALLSQADSFLEALVSGEAEYE